MQKKIKLILFSIIACLIFITNVNAKEDVVINKLYIRTEPELAGAFEVYEVIEVKGNYTQFDLDLYYKNLDAPTFTGLDSDLENSSIYNATKITLDEIGILNIEELNFNDFIDSTSNFISDNVILFEESDKTYKTELEDDKLKLHIYNNDNKDVNYYYIKYVIHNLIVEHNDYAELKYYYLDGNLKYDINELMILCDLPFSDPNFKIWVHGPKNGEAIKIEEGNGAFLTFTNVKKYTKIDVRVLYDLSLFPININESKKSNLDSLSIIEKIEDEISKNTDKNNRIYNIIYYLIIIITTIYFILLIVASVKEYINYLNSKELFNDEYYKKKFDNVVSLMKLLGVYKVNTYLLDMIDRDIIRYDNNKISIGKNSKYKKLDKEVLKYILEKDKSITIDELNKRKNKFNFKKLVDKNKHEFNKLLLNKILLIIFSLFGFIISYLFYKIVGEEYLSFTILLSILSLILLIYTLFKSPYDNNGKELLNKYKAFIRYIKNISNSNDVDLKLFSSYIVILSIKNNDLIKLLNDKYNKLNDKTKYKYEKLKELNEKLNI
jgi:hypothetical protein